MVQNRLTLPAAYAAPAPWTAVLPTCPSLARPAGPGPPPGPPPALPRPRARHSVLVGLETVPVPGGRSAGQLGVQLVDLLSQDEQEDGDQQDTMLSNRRLIVRLTISLLFDNILLVNVFLLGCLMLHESLPISLLSDNIQASTFSLSLLLPSHQHRPQLPQKPQGLPPLLSQHQSLLSSQDFPAILKLFLKDFRLEYLVLVLDLVLLADPLQSLRALFSSLLLRPRKASLLRNSGGVKQSVEQLCSALQHLLPGPD